MQAAPLTFRLYQSVKLNRPVNKDEEWISPGGYEIQAKDENGKILSLSFDFEDYEGNVDEKDPTVVHCVQKNPDYAYFPDLKILNEFMLHHIVSVKEWFIYTGEPDDLKEGETPLIPVEIRDPRFEIILPMGNRIQIPVTAGIVPTSNFSNE